MYFGFGHGTICKLHGGYAPHLSPTTSTISALQIASDVHAFTCCNGFNVSNLTDDLKIRHSSPLIIFLGRGSLQAAQLMIIWFPHKMPTPLSVGIRRLCELFVKFFVFMVFCHALNYPLSC